LLARFSGHNVPTLSSSSKNLKLTSNHQKSLLTHSKPIDLIGPLEDEAFLDEVLNDSSGTYGKFKSH
ncbi:hypothetical protein O181_109467, partial [Austropuccinia psidii MF-1]|nr:hypothetical protein [Austropuccinia psidii MF-1]